MWIRSQDKGYLVKSPIIDIDIKKNEVYILDRTYAKEPFIGRILGVYKSKERALEVLDEIEAFIENNYISIDDMPSHNNSPYPNYCPTHFTTMTRKKVFKMPEEE